VTAVSPLTAQIDLITAAKNGQVSARLSAKSAARARSASLADGQKDLIEMRYVPGSVEVKPGTSFIRRGKKEFIRRLENRRSRRSDSGSATTAHQIFIRPSGELNSLRKSVSLLYEPPPRPEFEQKLPNALKDAKKKQ
jgi:hypothetical protein